MKKIAFKEKAKGFRGKSKEFVKKAKDYKNQVQGAYELGYTMGWENAHRFPNVAGASASASNGFKTGIDRVHNTEKYSARYNKIKSRE